MSIILSRLILFLVIAVIIFSNVLTICIIVTYFKMSDNLKKIKELLEEVRDNTDGLVTIEVKKARYNQNR